MAYLVAGISGLVSKVGKFCVKNYPGLSAKFLATLGFLAMMPWSLKIPICCLVDVLWQH